MLVCAEIYGSCSPYAMAKSNRHANNRNHGFGPQLSLPLLILIHLCPPITQLLPESAGSQLSSYGGTPN